MRTLYLECRMGAAGDMLAAALLSLQSDADAALRRLNGLGIEGVCVAARKTSARDTVHGSATPTGFSRT